MTCVYPTRGWRRLVAVAPRTGKMVENVFERGENLLQNGILNFAFK